jgi:type I restriction enzyme M protein
VDVFNKGLEQDRFSRLVPYDEIAGKNEFNLNIPRYIDSSEPEDIHDLDAHLNGGIPNRDIDALQDYWDVFPSIRATLFKDASRAGYSDPLVEEREVKPTILGHAEFESFKSNCLELFEGWKAAHRDNLMAIDVGISPKELIFDVSEDLLARYADAQLLSKYNVYQILMDYWSETMQDDVYMLAQDGWKAANVVRQLVPVKDKKGKAVYKEEHDFEFGAAKSKKRFRSDIVRPELVIARYFAEQKAELDKLQTAYEEATQTLETFVEENSGEEGLIEESKNDKGKVSQKGIKDRLKEASDADEIAALKKCLKLVAEESKCKSAVKAAQDALDEMVFKKIPAIPNDELKDIVVNAKWLASVEAQIIEEIERVTQNLANRVKTLEQRYSKPLPSLSEDVSKYTNLVEGHLKKMGLSW